MERTITADPDLARSGTDAGDVYELHCPECGDLVSLGTFHEWWDTTCQCGRQWSLTIVAHGTRDEGDEP